MRSSLDHLMWLLARPKTAKQESDVQFPLLRPLPRVRGVNRDSSRKRFAGTSHMMPGVSRGVRTLVEGLQPYHSRKRPKTALLGQLNAISNRDKHRTLATTAVGTTATESDFRITGQAAVKNVEHFTPVLKAGAILVRCEVAYSVSGAEVYMKPT